jgi:amicyanin
MNRKIIAFIIFAALIILGVVIGLAVSRPDNKAGTPTTRSTSPSVTTNAVTIENYAYNPKSAVVKVGTTVTWTNKDSVRHTVTADTASSDAPNSQLFGKDETYSFTFKKAGTYSYFCEPHPYMKGTVTVIE